MKNIAKLRSKWLVFSFSGLLLVGLGLTIVGEAILLKMGQEAYFLMGTIGLVAFNTGLSIFGQAVIFRYRYLQAKGREASEYKGKHRRPRGRGRGPSGGNGSSRNEGGNRSSALKSRFEE